MTGGNGHHENIKLNVEAVLGGHRNPAMGAVTEKLSAVFRRTSGIGMDEEWGELTRYPAFKSYIGLLNAVSALCYNNMAMATLKKEKVANFLERVLDSLPPWVPPERHDPQCIVGDHSIYESIQDMMQDSELANADHSWKLYHLMQRLDTSSPEYYDQGPDGIGGKCKYTSACVLTFTGKAELMAPKSPVKNYRVIAVGSTLEESQKLAAAKMWDWLVDSSEYKHEIEMGEELEYPSMQSAIFMSVMEYCTLDEVESYRKFIDLYCSDPPMPVSVMRSAEFHSFHSRKSFKEKCIFNENDIELTDTILRLILGSSGYPRVKVSESHFQSKNFLSVVCSRMMYSEDGERLGVVDRCSVLNNYLNVCCEGKKKKGSWEGFQRIALLCCPCVLASYSFIMHNEHYMTWRIDRSVEGLLSP
jgi:hypothetical protein